MRSCEALPQKQHAKQDARRRQRYPPHPLLLFPHPPKTHRLISSPNSRSLRNSRPRVPHGRSPRTSRQRSQRPESKTHHAAPLTTRDPRRRGARHADSSDDCVWRRFAPYQSCAVAQGRAEEEGEGWCLTFNEINQGCWGCVGDGVGEGGGTTFFLFELRDCVGWAGVRDIRRYAIFRVFIMGVWRLSHFASRLR